MRGSRLLPPVFPFDWAGEWGEDRYGPWVAFRLKGVRQCLRWIAPGRFWMGSPPDERERSSTERRHEVTLTQGFWLADTTCTQALWEAVMGDNPSRFKGAERPVEQVSWDQVKEFIDRLNAALPGLDARLPTEAQWEHACRTGTETPFWFGDQITPEQVNYDGNYPYADGAKCLYWEQTVEVKALPCNAWGLYQLHGNVWEWCQDCYGDYPTDFTEDPTGPQTGVGRVVRGGCWISHAGLCRSAQRDHRGPAGHNVLLGFRLARGP
ncbi:formylglycine-generating enzyme family protein [uncultured Thiodictyon sp.]|uniref:formylglycine-generating enzyme family protein n=1 Tax=uncultured Thiodictyon sp. TaxID=1846217 RepID=UPI0025EC7803|nr:formylglycine-generating enzyme family protein [uncultured Thiodictyon sp.]